MDLTSFSINVFSAPESSQRCHITSSCHVFCLYCSVTVLQPFFLFFSPWLWQFWRVVESPSIWACLLFFYPINTLGYGFWGRMSQRWSTLTTTLCPVTKWLKAEWLIADQVNLDHLFRVVFTKFLHWMLRFPPFHIIFFRSKLLMPNHFWEQTNLLEGEETHINI